MRRLQPLTILFLIALGLFAVVLRLGLLASFDNRLSDLFVRLHAHQLTPDRRVAGFLLREADAQLKNGRMLWWRDDTHWNRAGIAVAAHIVAQDIGGPEGKRR